MKHTKKKIDNGWKYRDYEIIKDAKKWICDNKPFKTLGLAQTYINDLLDNEKTNEVSLEVEQSISLIELMEIFRKEYNLPKPTKIYKNHSDKVTLRYQKCNSDIAFFSNLREDLKEVKDYGKDYGYECFFRITLYPDDDFWVSLHY